MRLEDDKAPQPFRVRCLCCSEQCTAAQAAGAGLRQVSPNRQSWHACPCSPVSWCISVPVARASPIRAGFLLLHMSDGPYMGQKLLSAPAVAVRRHLPPCITLDMQHWLALQRGEATGSAGTRGLAALAGGRDQEAT